MRQVVWLLQAALFYGGTLLAALVPESLSDRLGSRIGLLMYRFLGRRRRIAEENISLSLDYMRSQPGWTHAVQDVQGITQEVFRTMGRSLLEICRLYHGRGEGLINRIELRGVQHFDAARAKGKGLVFLAGHCGNWELGALASGWLLHVPVSVVVRRQDNPYLNRMVEKMRMRFNNRVIYKDHALKSMLAAIKANEAVGLLVDQAVLPEDGCRIDFLGRPAWASKAPVLLARRTGVTVLPVFAHREGNRMVLELQPELVFSGDKTDQGLMADVQLYSRTIEQFIIRHPADWYWVHRRWKRA
jgi:KDO2-lipid IV(A) lauroyltransferase